MRYLRWQGLLTFVVIVASIVLFFYLFAESLIKLGIEKGAGSYNGAEVNVEKVELTYSPLTITVKGLQVTDAKQPELNSVAFARATAGIDFWQYLLGKVIIDEVSVEGLQFANQRAQKGEVYLKDKNTEANTTEKSAALPEVKIELPDAKTLVNNSNLITVKASQELAATYQAEKEKLSTIQNNIPDKARLADYEAQLKVLAATKVESIEDLEALKVKYEALKAQFEADKAQVKQAKAQLSETKKLIGEKVTALKNAPSQDWQNIKTTYQLDNVDGADFAHILFGEKAREYYNIALTVYQKLAPLMKGGKAEEAIAQKQATTGRFVYFNEANPLPEFLINRMHFSVLSPNGDFNVELKEVTHQHWVRALPTTYLISSSNLLKKGKGEMQGQLLLSEDKQFSSEGKWTLSDGVLENAVLQDSKKLNLLLSQGKLNGSGTYTIVNKELDSQNSFSLSQATYQGNADSSFGRAVVDAVSSLDNLSVKVSAQGDITKPEFHISSPLDRALKGAVMAQVDKKVDSLKADLQASLNAKVASALGSGDDAQLVSLEGLLNSQEAGLDSLLNKDIIKEQEDKLKQKAEDKAKDKLKKKLGNLF